jgi:hypothetical protein
MKKIFQLVFLFGLLGIIFLLYKDQVYTMAWENRENMPGLVQTVLENTQGSMGYVTPAVYARQVHADAALKPDNRVLIAIRELHYLFTGESPDIAFSRMEDNAWRVTGSNVPANMPQLDDLAGFAGIKTFLTAYLAGLQDDTNPPRTQAEALVELELRPDTMDPMANIRLLFELNRLGADNPVDSGMLTIAAKAMIRLVYTSYDLLEMTEVLEGKSLALLVAAQVLSGESLGLEESLLAFRLGYPAYAMQLLPQAEEPAWRYFLQRDDLQLASVARDTEPDSLAKYLWLQRLVQADRQADWLRIMAQYFDTPQQSFAALATGARLSNFSFLTAILDTIPSLVYEQVEASLDPLSIEEDEENESRVANNGLLEKLAKLARKVIEQPDANLPEVFTEKLEQASRNFTGPYLDTDSFQAYFNGYFYSSYYRLGLHYLDNLSSVDAAATYARQLDGFNSGPGGELKTWYNNLISAEQGRVNAAAMLSDLQGMTAFGLPPLLRTVEGLLPYYGFGRPEQDTIASFLVKCMDARIRHRFQYAMIARDHLLDLNQSEHLLWSIVQEETGANQATAAWLAYYYDHPEEILQIAADKSQPVSTRTYAVTLLDSYSENEDAIWRLLTDLRHEEPEVWSVFETYFSVGEKLENHAEVIRVADVWLGKQQSNPNAFNDWKATIAKSRAQLALGEPEAAWDTVRPIIKSQYGPAMLHGVDVLLALDSKLAANDLAVTSLERYPSSVAGLGKRLKTLWADQQFNKAAEVAAGWKYSSGAKDWRWTIGADLAAALKDHSEWAAEAAWSMKAAGVEGWKLRELAAQAANENQYQIAYEFQSRVTTSGPGQLAYDVETYRYLVQLEGKENAVRWIASRIPDGRRNFSSMILYSAKAMDLLWELIPNPDHEMHGYVVWLYRAAAMLEGYPVTESQRAQLVDYYNNVENGHYQLLGKYLMNLIPEEDLLHRAMNKRELNETTYYLGVKALSEVRYYDAVDWFRACISTGDYNSGEYRWAYEYLYLMQNKGKSLDVLAAEGKLTRE